MKVHIKYLVYTLVLCAFVVWLVKDCNKPVVTHEKESIHDTTLKVVQRTDTVRIARTIRDTVYGHALDNSPCPDFSFFSIQGGDSVWGIASCNERAVYGLTVGHTPIYLTHTDTVLSTRDVEKTVTVVEHRNPLSLEAFGDYDVLNKQISAGILGSLSFNSLTIYGGPAFDGKLKVVAGTSIQLLP